MTALHFGASLITDELVIVFHSFRWLADILADDGVSPCFAWNALPILVASLWLLSLFVRDVLNQFCIWLAVDCAATRSHDGDALVFQTGLLTSW